MLPIKTFFERMPSGYRPGSSLDFARAIGAESMVLHCNLTGALERAELARRAGLPIWWWAGPDAWKPGTWRTTRARCLQLIAGGHGLGYVPDCETAPDWAGQTAELDALAAALDSDTRAGLSVGFTSFPSWPYWRRVAHRARGVWACPQLYGIVTPGTPAELLRRGAPWAQEFGGGYVPALAAWGRDANEQREYLAGMASVPGAIFWHGLPAPRGGVLSALRDWTPSRPFPPAPPAPEGPPGVSGC